MLGLTPGATTANLNLNWISTSANCSSTSTDDGKTLVRIFNASGSLVNVFTGTAAKGPSGKCVHKATITGLTPATSYKYSVSNNDKDWSNDYNYKTPPSGSVFTFAVITDPQITDGAQDNNTKPKASPSTTAQGWADVVKKITETEATFIVSAGDQVDSYTYSPSQYTKFFAPEGLRSLPFAPVVGNHDGHQEYMHHFNMPNVSNSSGYGIYTGVAGNYYYLYNNILFVAFNTGYAPKDLAAAKTSMAEYEKVIKAAKAAHSGYDWLIVQHHKSTTSISSHACDMEIQHYIDAGFEKLITDEGVDIVISGHDHIHVRSHLMKWDNTKKYSVRSTDKGTIYLTFTTASGVKFYPPFPFSNSTMYDAIVNGEFAATAGYSEEHPVLVDLTRGLQAFRKTTSDTKDKWPLSTDFCVAATRTNYLPNYTPNYTIFKVNGKTINATTYTTENVKVDEFTLTPKGR
jgi:predicted phosphodiesterase